MNIQEIIDYNKPLLESLGFDFKKFYPKKVYKYNNDDYVFLYKRELTTPETIYTEFIDKEGSLLYKERRLFKFKGNPLYENEYENFKDDSYKIPLEDWEEIIFAKPIEKTNFDESFDDRTDDSQTKMTIRDRCAIEWKLPVSHKEWLNNLIKTKFNEHGDYIIHVNTKNKI